jgi:two-component system, NarL family, response regulator LiaR
MPEMPMIRVVIVDDHAVVRSGLQFFLQRTQDICVVGEAESGPEAFVLVEELQPDLVIMDIMMPDEDGIAIVQQIRQQFPAVRVIALTTPPEGSLVQRALQVGAIGYLLKDIHEHELATAIRAAYSGHPVLAPEVAKTLVAVSDQPPKLGTSLSMRELDVLRLMVAGQSNEQIAAQLEITRNTVRHHVHNILVKLGAVNRAEAVGLAVQYKLVVRS